MCGAWRTMIADVRDFRLQCRVVTLSLHDGFASSESSLAEEHLTNPKK